MAQICKLVIRIISWGIVDKMSCLCLVVYFFLKFLF